jgi:nucleotide-binding universal stress UspA family protein
VPVVRRILVGVDGSEGSRQALAWAIGHAAAFDAFVQPVIVWQRTFDYGSDHYWPADEAIAEDARKRLTAAIAEVADPDPAVTIDPLVLEGDPGKTLCAQSAAADLLVVGSRGLGGFAGLVLGSVSTKCAHHGRCPVVIVPHSAPPGDGEA